MTDTKLETLIEDYQRRIRSATTIIEDPATSQSQRERVLVKLGEYKAFLRDLESLEEYVPTPKGNGMTDTVNKQALDSAISMLSLLMNRGHINFKNYGCPTQEEISELIARLSYTPSTPVQGYREELEGVHRILISGDDYTEAKDLRSVITSATWACAEALSQTDIQPSKTTEPQQFHILIHGHVKTFTNESEAWQYFRKAQDGGYEPTFFYGKDGINSTEDDQTGPSISSTQLMLEGEEQ